MSAPERHEMYCESGPSGSYFRAYIGCLVLLFVVVVLVLGWLL